MSAKRFMELSRDATIPISIGLLISMLIGVYALAVRIERWESTLLRVSRESWSSQMEAEAWTEFRERNRMAYPDLVTPNIREIRRYNGN
jgi:hypothetical protein